MNNLFYIVIVVVACFQSRYMRTYGYVSDLVLATICNLNLPSQLFTLNI